MTFDQHDRTKLLDLRTITSKSVNGLNMAVDLKVLDMAANQFANGGCGEPGWAKEKKLPRGGASVGTKHRNHRCGCVGPYTPNLMQSKTYQPEWLATHFVRSRSPFLFKKRVKS